MRVTKQNELEVKKSLDQMQPKLNILDFLLVDKTNPRSKSLPTIVRSNESDT